MSAVLDTGHFAQRLVRRTPVLAIASGKGGVGKTWFSVTLAHALARAGRRILLFDGDLGLANVDIQLGLAPRLDLAAVVGGRSGMEEAITPYPAGGFDILAGRSGSAGLVALPPEAVDRLARELARTAQAYDTVVLDLGAGVERTAWRLAGASTACLVLCTDEPTSLTDAYAFTKLSLRANPTRDLRVVVNQAASRGDGERTYRIIAKACDSFLKITPPLAGIVRRDRRVHESVRAQSPVLTRHPRTPAAEDVTAIAAEIARELGRDGS